MGNKHSGLRHFKINFHLSCSTMAKDFFKMLPQILYRQPLHGEQEKKMTLLGWFTKQVQTKQRKDMNKTTVFICKIGIKILKRTTREAPVDKERDV